VGAPVRVIDTSNGNENRLLSADIRPSCEHRIATFERALRARPDARPTRRAYANDTRALALLVVVMLSGCTVTFTRKLAETETLKQRIAYFQWLYHEGFYRSDPQMMKQAATKLLAIEAQNCGESSSQTEALERLAQRLEAEVDRLTKDKR